VSMFRISDRPIQPADLCRQLTDVRAGGFVSFEGRVRSRSGGRKVRALEYEVYGALAAKEGERIVSEARRRFAIRGAACVHRIGRVPVGEVAVWVGVTAEHRDAAFAACRFIIDQLKTRVPIWKKEHSAAGPSRWVNPVPAGGTRLAFGEKSKIRAGSQSARIPPRRR